MKGWGINMANKNLNNAKKEKNDEFYTQLSDIENEMKHYKEHFKGKVIFCNCDDPEESNFWKFFSLNFKYLGLKKLIATHYDRDKPSYKLEMTSVGVKKILLKQNGDFRSPECVSLLKECDIVITNPPFSLFREFVALLEEYDKKYLIIGNMNAITYKEVFKLIKDNKLWLGYSGRISNFEVPNSMFDINRKDMFIINNKKYQKLGNVVWFTNLIHNKRNEDLILYKSYNEKDYPKYDNYDAINVDKVKDIPKDYKGVMGVPISFLDKFNPKQFEIVAFRKGEDGKDLVFTSDRERVQPYFRILVRHQLRGWSKTKKEKSMEKLLMRE